jgi:signal transduction histidine kinase
LQPFEATAAQLATAIDSRAQQLNTFRKSREIAVLQERHRLARELHDSVTQILFSLTLIAQTIVPSFQRSTDEGTQRVARLLELSEKALEEMHALLDELRLDGDPDSVCPVRSAAIGRVRSIGLRSALDELCDELRRDGFVIRLTYSTYSSQALAIEEALYGIARESFANFVKHAGDAAVDACLSCEKDTVVLQIRDSGCGFETRDLAPDNSAARRGMGISNMRERVETVGGRLILDSAPGRGTTVEAHVPIGQTGVDP